jgi:hypothetical protein
MMESVRFLLSQGPPSYTSVMSELLTLDTWKMVCKDWHVRPNSQVRFRAEFKKCRELTSLALQCGARPDEFIDKSGENILHYMASTPMQFQEHQRLRIMRYLVQVGFNIEHRNNQGRTPLLNAIGSFGYAMIPALLAGNANLQATDNKGQGYLEILFDDISHQWDIECEDAFSVLLVLLGADRRFSERAITSSEIPLFSELASSKNAWEVWTSVFEEMGWDMEAMNSARFTALMQPLPDGISCGLEEHLRKERRRMIKKTCSQLSVAKVAVLTGGGMA